MKKRRNVITCTGGGGSSLPAKLGIEDVSSPCHAELVSASVQRCELPVTLARSRNRLARLAKNGTAKSVVFALCLRSLAQFGMTLVAPVLHLNPSDCTTRKLGAKDVTQSSSRGANEVSDVVIQAAERHPRLVEHDFLTPNQLGSRLDRRWIATPAKPARNDRGWLEHAAFTMAARLSRSTESVAERLPQLNPSKNLAFTMAEILLSLTIIGVVAAITLPSLTGNINERTWNTQRKALYARMSQALPLMDALNGYGTVTEATSSSSAIDNAAETFVTAGLSKAFKINNICAHDKLHDCGIASKIVSLKGNNINTSELTNLGGLNSELVVPNTANSTVLNTYSLYDTNAAAFETANGESIIVYYNPTCTGSLGETTYNQSTGSAMGGFNIHPWVCANFIYDLNGNKGPNTVGKDIGFMTAFYPYDAILYAPYPAPSPISGSYTRNQVKKCTEYDPDYRAPKANELASMFVNKKLIDADSYTENNTGGGYITTETEVLSSGNIGGITQRVDTGFRDAHGVGALWCVKR